MFEWTPFSCTSTYYPSNSPKQLFQNTSAYFSTLHTDTTLSLIANPSFLYHPSRSYLTFPIDLASLLAVICLLSFSLPHIRAKSSFGAFPVRWAVPRQSATNAGSPSGLFLNRDARFGLLIRLFFVYLLPLMYLLLDLDKFQSLEPRALPSKLPNQNEILWFLHLTYILMFFIGKRK